MRGFSLRCNPLFPCANRESNPDLKLFPDSNFIGGLERSGMSSLFFFDQTKAEQSSAGLYRVKLCKTFFKSLLGGFMPTFLIKLFLKVCWEARILPLNHWRKYLTNFLSVFGLSKQSSIYLFYQIFLRFATEPLAQILPNLIWYLRKYLKRLCIFLSKCNTQLKFCRQHRKHQL